MKLDFFCPECDKKLSADRSLAGRMTRCTRCGAKIPIPGQPHAPAADAEPAVAHDSPSGEAMLGITSKPQHDEDLIDMTAMVDIVFFLLIFFLVTSLKAVEAVMNMPPAQAPQSATAKAKTVVDYESDPDFIVIRIEEDDSIWVEDEQIFGEQNLRVRMKNLKNESADPRSVVVFGNADASHGAAVEVFDACMSAGIEDIRLSVQDDTAGQ